MRTPEEIDTNRIEDAFETYKYDNDLETYLNDYSFENTKVTITNFKVKPEFQLPPTKSDYSKKFNNLI